MYFLTNSSFRLAKMEFMSSEKSIFLFRAFLKLLKFGGDNSCLWKLIFWLVELIFTHFSDTPPSESYFPSSVNVILNESSSRYGGDTFSVLWKPFSLIKYFFLTVEAFNEISGNPFLGGKDFIPTSRKQFLSSENCFLLFRSSFLRVEISSLYFL